MIINFAIEEFNTQTHAANEEIIIIIIKNTFIFHMFGVCVCRSTIALYKSMLIALFDEKRHRDTGFFLLFKN